jgi:maleylacetoacetate isomerase
LNAKIPKRGFVHLYSFFRSSAAYRVRIALNLKGLSAEMTSVKCATNEHRTAEYRSVNPQMRVPTMVLDSGETLTQSLAIIEYLDETHPQPPLLPFDPLVRAQARAVAQVVACDIHPLNNIGALNYLRGKFGQDEAAVNAWYHHWVLEGFEAIETMLRPGPYCFGASVSIADIALVPQVYNARRFKVPLDRFPNIVAVDAACAALPAFAQAAPEKQFDAA